MKDTINNNTNAQLRQPGYFASSWMEGMDEETEALCHLNQLKFTWASQLIALKTHNKMIQLLFWL